jgi:PAS domain S-box-containing protein
MIERLPILVVSADGAPSLEIARVAREAGCSPILCDDRASARRALVANRLFLAIVEVSSDLESAAELCSWLRQQPGGRQIRIITCNPNAWSTLIPLIDAGADDIASFSGDSQTLGGRLTVAKARLLSRRRESPFDFPSGAISGNPDRPQLLAHELLARIRQMAWDETELPRLYRSFVEGASAAFGFSQVAIYTFEGEMLSLQHLVGFDRRVDRIPLERGIIGKTARTGVPIVLEDVTKDPDYIGGVTGVTSEICVPFHADGVVIGVINIESIQGAVLDERDLPLILALRDHLEAAIARINAFDWSFAHDQGLRRLIDAAPIGLFKLDRELRIVEINQRAAELLGRERTELFERPLSGVLEPEAQSLFERAARKVLTGVQARTAFTAFTPADSALQFMLAANHNERDETLSIVGTIDDGTDRHTAETKLGEVQRLLTGIAAGGTTIGTIDSSGTIELIATGKQIDPSTIVTLPSVASILQNPAVPATVRARLTNDHSDGAWLDLAFAPIGADGKRVITIREASTDVEQQQALHTALDRFRPSFDDPIAPSAILDKTGRFTVVSESMSSLLGYSEAELQAMVFQQLTYPEDVESTVASFRKLVSGETSACIAKRRFFHRDGQTIPTLIRAVAISSEQITPHEFLLTMITLEHTEELEQRLRDVSSRYDALVNALPIVTFTSPRDTSDMVNLFYSPQVEAMLGYSIEYLTRDIDRFYEFIHPDDLHRIHIADQIAETENDSFDETYRFIRGDGRTIWLRAQSVPVFGEGDEALYWQGVFTDVTALKQSELQAIEREARYRDLVANAPLLIATIDRDAAIVTVNDAVERMLGYEASELTSGKLALDTHPEDRDRLRTTFGEIVSHPGAKGSTETRFKHRNGQWIRFKLEMINRNQPDSNEAVLVYGSPTAE